MTTIQEKSLWFLPLKRTIVVRIIADGSDFLLPLSATYLKLPAAAIRKISAHNGSYTLSPGTSQYID